MKRWIYLDVIRGIAILLMVVDHMFDWLLTEAGQATGLARTAEFLGTLAAPLFLFLVGVGLAFSVQRSTAAGRDRQMVIRYLLLRGGKLVIWGYGLNLLVFFTGDNLVDIFAVDILQVIGVSIWLSLPLLWLPNWVAAVSALVVFILGQAAAGSWMLPAWLAAYINGQGGIGYFPLALWLPYTYLGLAVGKSLGIRPSHGRVLASLVGASVVGFTGYLMLDPAWGYRHPQPIFVLFSLVFLFTILLFAWVWVERFERRGFLVMTIRDMGLAALMVYVLHHLVGYRLFWLLGWVSGRSWRGEFGVFSPLAATLLFAGMLVLLTLVTHFWLHRRIST